MSSTSSRMGRSLNVPTKDQLKKIKMSETSNDSGSFAGTVKMICRQYTNNKCWFCEVTDVEIAHVVAKEDKAIPDLFSKGLINFQLTSALNGMPLCPTCHTNFDNAMNPGWFFIPEDLDFFIRQETVDMNRRAIEGACGKVTQRVCPTVTEYAASHGGVARYTRILLRPETINPPPGGFKFTAEWEGAPMAAIRRGFIALGSMRCAIIPDEIVDKLRKLQYLYQREPEVKTQSFATPADTMDFLRPLKMATDECPDETIEMSMSAKKRTRTYLPDDQDMWDQENPRRQSFDATGWVLGPESTSDSAAKKFRPLFGHFD